MSDKWGTKLQNLVPIAVEPVHPVHPASERNRALQELQEIATIRVSYCGKDTTACYAVEVFTDSVASSSRSELMSTESTQSDSTTATSTEDVELPTPAIRIERELCEFTSLREKVFNVVHSAHYSKQCDFCTAVLHWIVLGTNPDGMFLPLLGGKRVARKLTKFLTDLLACTEQLSLTGRRNCSGEILVPQMMFDFLFKLPTLSDAA